MTTEGPPVRITSDRICNPTTLTISNRDSELPENLTDYSDGYTLKSVMTMQEYGLLEG